MRVINVRKVDAFTDKPLSGNPAGIVLNADGLSYDEMVKIAYELNMSETAFIMKPTSIEANFKVRFFTPTTEVNLCGHATIAANYCLAMEGMFKLKEPITLVMQETNIGILPIEIHVKNSDIEKVMMTQAKPKVEAVDVQVSKVAKALRTDISEILDTKLPLQISSTGLPFLIVPIKHLNTLINLKPDFIKISEISKELNVPGLYVFALETLEKSSTAHARCFAPYVGINEDPVTGTASGALASYLVMNKAVKFKETHTSLIIEQGYAINRPGKVHVQVKIKNDKPVEVKVGGKAVITMEGRMVIY